MTFHETPYYYASIILHPDHGFSWFEKHWKSYAWWIKEDKTGMKSFVESFGQSLDGSESKAVEEGRSVGRELTKAVL